MNGQRRRAGLMNPRLKSPNCRVTEANTGPCSYRHKNRWARRFSTTTGTTSRLALRSKVTRRKPFRSPRFAKLSAVVVVNHL